MSTELRLGVAVPHRAVGPLHANDLVAVARRAEELGMTDLWVTDNILDKNNCLDSVVALSYAAAATERIGLGVSVLILPIRHPVHVAHQWATLDSMSGGRVTLGVGLGREEHLTAFGLPVERRVRRFLETTEAIRALWRGEEVTAKGEVEMNGARIGISPSRVNGPHIWFGGMHPNAVRRAARHADGWMASGHSSSEDAANMVRHFREQLEGEGRHPQAVATSKRVFLMIDDDRASAERAVRNWFGDVYGDPELTAGSGVFGTLEQVAEQLSALEAAGFDHLLLNPVEAHKEQLEAIADLFGPRP